MVDREKKIKDKIIEIRIKLFGSLLPKLEKMIKSESDMENKEAMLRTKDILDKRIKGMKERLKI